MLRKYTPLRTVPSYNYHFFKSDLLAAITLFFMLVPQGMAYAMLAGVPPVIGLYASTIPLIIYAFLGSSRHLSVGPVAITSLLVFSSVSVYAQPGTANYISIVITLTLLVGAIQFILGVVKAGFIVKFIPHSVLNGYTSAAAIVIGLSQFKHLLGLENTDNNLQVHLLLFGLVQNINEIQFTAFFIGIICLASILLVKRIHSRLPAALFVVLFSISIVALLQLDQSGLKIVGAVPQGLPSFIVPAFKIETVQLLLPMALTIALIGYIESLAIAKAVAQKEKYRIEANQELRALGLSNITGSCLHSLPINGSFSRTAINHQSGGVTQVTSILTGVFVLVTLQFFTFIFYYLPHAALSAIIIAAVYRLIDWKEMRHLFQVKRTEGWIWVITFLVTLFIGIQWGIIIGAFFSLLLLLQKSAKPNIAELGYIKAENVFRDIRRFPNGKTSEKVLILRIDSSLHFINISFLEEKLKQLLEQREHTKWVILDLSGVNDIDTVSVDRLEELLSYYQTELHITFLFAHMKGSIRDTVKKVDWDQKYPSLIKYNTLEQLLEEYGLVSYFDHSDQTFKGTLEPGNYMI